MDRVLIWSVRVAAVIGTALLVLTTTARLTLLDARFDTRAIAANDGYERVYSEILPSPGVQAVIREGLRGLPVDPTYFTANVRILLPPPVLEQVVREVVSGYVDVLSGSSVSVELSTLLQPIVDNVVQLVIELLPGVVASAPLLTSSSLTAFGADVGKLLRQLADGSPDLRLPTLRFDAQTAPQVAAILTAGLGSDRAATLQAEIAPLLVAGDLSSALAAVVPAYLDDSTVRELSARASTGAQVVAARLPASAGGTHLHPILPLGLTWLTVIGVLLLLPALRFTLPARRSTAAREIALIFGSAGALALLAGWAVRAVAPDPLLAASRDSSWSPVSRRLAGDVDATIRHGVTHVNLELTGLVVLVAVGSLLIAAWRRAPAGHRGRLAGGLATATLGASGLAVLAVPLGSSALTCNGSARLCDRAYNQVTYLTSHNAMASSDRGFLGADQDPSITGQLDNGVRALMLDLHYWTTPDEAAPLLDTLDERTKSAWAPLVGTFQPHSGVWLCHDMCQLGADSAVDQLRALRAWLSSHPDNVVTLIIEDHVSSADVRATLSAAGLDRWLASPPRPGQPWPTLAQMIHRRRTLAVFTERAAAVDGPVRNFYQYAAETPYQADRPAALTCDPGRGAATAPLFLVNNWVTTPAPARSAALAVNSRGYLLDRVRRCEEQRGMHASFVAVDFAQIGRPLEVVDALNARPPPA